MVYEHSEQTIAKLRLTLPHRGLGLSHQLIGNSALGTTAPVQAAGPL